MKDVWELRFHAGSKEELLPGLTPAFPYIASRVELDRYPNRSAPWHWHGAVELSYTQKGCIKYYTPGGMALLPQGSAVLVNANVLHMTTAEPQTVQLLHIFEPSFLAAPDSVIAERYLAPLTSASHAEMLCLTPDDPAQAEVLEQVKAAFALQDGAYGYEVKLRNILSLVWLALLEQAKPLLEGYTRRGKTGTQVREMMAYIHEHYGEKLTVADLAASVFLSPRACFRVFREHLHTTPLEYLKSYRLQQACRLLQETELSVTDVGQRCGLGSSSYFGKTFREAMGCTPLEYRYKWQDIDNEWRKSDIQCSARTLK